MRVSLVPHRALINCARRVTFEEVLTGVSASQPSSRPPFSPLLPHRLIYRPVFYESCSSPPLISRGRSDGPRQGKAGSTVALCSRGLARQGPNAQLEAPRFTHLCFLWFQSLSPVDFLPPSRLRSRRRGKAGRPPAGVCASNASNSRGISNG